MGMESVRLKPKPRLIPMLDTMEDTMVVLVTMDMDMESDTMESVRLKPKQSLIPMLDTMEDTMEVLAIMDMDTVSDTMESVKLKLSLTPMFCMDMEDLDTTPDTMDTLDMEVSSLDRNNNKAYNTKTQSFQLIVYTHWSLSIGNCPTFFLSIKFSPPPKKKKKKKKKKKNKK